MYSLTEFFYGKFALIIIVILALTRVAALDAAEEAIEGPRRPNILFIMSDDHAAHGLSCYGSEIFSTPNIDRLADEGMRFTTTVGVNSLCAPSRAIFLTGKHSHCNGMLRNYDRFDGSQQTFPKLLQKAGYETAIVGKWHLGIKPTGFDYYKVMRGQGSFFDCTFRETGKDWHVEKGYLTNVITDKSIEWLENRSSDKPFCLMVHHKAPHGPYIHEPRHAKLFENETIPEPETLHDDWATRDPLKTGKNSGTKLINRPWSYESFKKALASADGKRGKTSAVYQEFIKSYMRLVVSLDENVGRLLDYVDRSGLRENTIVIYASDNGFFLGDHGLFNKMWIYKESLKIPLIVRYPGKVEPGTVNDDLVCNLDFAPTFLDFAGAEIPEDLQGRSILPLLEGRRPADWRKSIYYHYYGQYHVPVQYGLRTLDHTLVHFPKFGDGKYRELFDLKKDPHELHNVYDDPAYADEAERLMEEFRRRAKRVKAKEAGGS